MTPRDDSRPVAAAEPAAGASADTDADGGASELHCLDCGRPFRFEDLAALGAGDADDPYFDCPACGARNEVRAAPQPGLGAPPKARVVRLLNASRP